MSLGRPLRPSGHRARRARASAGAALASIFCATLALSAQASPRASAAYSTNVKDEAKLHFVRSSGATLSDEGQARGTIPGKVKISFTYTGSPTVSSQFTIYGSAGSIRVRASGRLSSPTSPSPSFKGTMTVSGGSGRYSHARGSGALYGVFNRRSYALVVQVQGTMYY
ncbi:MAG TPA: hypothetical protein VGI27_00020 [Solirubrobacteraceae bacterium]|jgi:hypothetical protein